MIDDRFVAEQRERGLSPEHPIIRGTVQNSDVYFQGREASNRFYDELPGIVQRTMDRFAELTGRAYHLFDYHGAPDAERVIVVMGSGSETVRETVDALVQTGPPSSPRSRRPSAQSPSLTARRSAAARASRSTSTYSARWTARAARARRSSSALRCSPPATDSAARSSRRAT